MPNPGLVADDGIFHYNRNANSLRPSHTHHSLTPTRHPTLKFSSACLACSHFHSQHRRLRISQRPQIRRLQNPKIKLLRLTYFGINQKPWKIPTTDDNSPPTQAHDPQKPAPSTPFHLATPLTASFLERKLNSNIVRQITLRNIISLTSFSIMGKKYGFSFSWKRAIGLSAAKGKLSKAIGVPLTRSGRQRKVGRAMGCLMVIGAFAASLISVGIIVLTVIV